MFSLSVCSSAYPYAEFEQESEDCLIFYMDCMSVSVLLAQCFFLAAHFLKCHPRAVLNNSTAGVRFAENLPITKTLIVTRLFSGHVQPFPVLPMLLPVSMVLLLYLPGRGPHEGRP
jgi:hypothetical protein